MSTERKFYTLDDGRVLTIDEIMALTGVSKKTTWVRLQTTRNYDELAKPTVFMKQDRGHKNYFEDTYKDLTSEQFKLLFGKWS
jgi:hypothetical protein